MTSRHRVPVWLMGLTNLTYGMFGGIVAYAIPQVLSLRNVPESSIAGLTAIAFSPGFWAFLFSPVLDVRFSRRAYATALAVIAAGLLFVAFLNLDHLGILRVTLTGGFLAAYLYQSALGGWISSITSQDEEKTLSIWITQGNVIGFGFMAVICNQLVARLSTMTVAVLLGLLVIAPTLVFPFMQAPGPDRRLASESFSQFFGDLWALVKRREVLIAVVMFLAPAGTFSLTNFLAARGADYHASAGFVGLIGGAGVAAAGAVGCFMLAPLSRLLPVRWLYLAIGLLGSLCTVGLIFLPRTPASFAVAIIVENVIQSLAITTSMAIIFETIGQNNPLASTTFCFVASMYGFPIVYMLSVDAFGYGRGGMTGSYLADGLAGVAASVLMGAGLWWLGRRGKLPIANAVEA
jgi:MFS transporter, PAT family, beta-lactamase induction signal transducer AmpG